MPEISFQKALYADNRGQNVGSVAGSDLARGQAPRSQRHPQIPPRDAEIHNEGQLRILTSHLAAKPPSGDLSYIVI